MPYNKTITINEEQDMFLQNNLQQYKNMSWSALAEQTDEIADSILTLIETAPETDVS